MLTASKKIIIQSMKNLLIILLLCFATGIAAEEKACEVERPSIVERVVTRSYPSIIGFSDPIIVNFPPPGSQWEWSYYKKAVSRRDLFSQGSFLAQVGFPRRADGSPHLVFRNGRYADDVVDRRRQIQALNPDHLFLVGLEYEGVNAEDGYPEDWPYWLRDEAGNRVLDPSWNRYIIDFTLPGAEDHIVEMAVSVAKCGIFDGIFMDLWGEEEGEELPSAEGAAHLYHGDRVEALVSLVKRIREAVGDDFLIVVNARTEKIPRSAPYVNGAHIETWDDAYPRERLIEIEKALSWYEENLRYPQVNNLKVAMNTSEPWDSPANRRLVRAATTLTLTHSNGYILIVGGRFKTDSYWYRFFDAPLGGTVGGHETKGVLYETPKGERVDGLFIREFTGGYVVYNRSGKERLIQLPEKVSGWHSGIEEKRWHTIGDLDGEVYLKPVATRADVNADGVVNILDLVLVANAFNATEPDLNGDGVVNILDLVWVANSIGNRK